MIKFLIRAEFSQEKPRDVVGLGSLKNYFIDLAIWKKACALPFPMDLHANFLSLMVYKTLFNPATQLPNPEEDSQSILKIFKIYFSLTCLGVTCILMSSRVLQYRGLLKVIIFPHSWLRITPDFYLQDSPNSLPLFLYFNFCSWSILIALLSATSLINNTESDHAQYWPQWVNLPINCGILSEVRNGKWFAIKNHEYLITVHHVGSNLPVNDTANSDKT